MFAIDISSMTNLYNPNGQLIILNRVDDSIITMANPETLLP